MSVHFVNYMDEPVALDATKHAKPKVAKEEQSSHKGWRVVGVPPDAMAQAQKQWKALDKVWDAEAWLRKFKKQAVRSKPHTIPQAAHDCVALAEKCGWTHLEIVEIKKELRAA